jgi:hypothetical protein
MKRQGFPRGASGFTRFARAVILSAAGMAAPRGCWRRRGERGHGCDERKRERSS